MSHFWLAAVAALTACGRVGFEPISQDTIGSVEVQFARGGWGHLDLTAAGTRDWSHWGHVGADARNHKAGVTPAIGEAAHIGGGTLLADHDNVANPVSWSDGTPTTAVTDADDVFYIDTAGASGDGFELTVTAEPVDHTLVLYMGNWCVRARFEAGLDGDASDADTSFDVATPDGVFGRYTVSFRPATAGQALVVRFTVADNHCRSGDLGEVWLIAASLE